MTTAFGDLTFRGQVGRLRELGRVALAQFPCVSGDARLTLLAHMDNSTFRVDTAGGARYALRIHRVSHSKSQPRRSVDNIRSEAEWLAALRRDTDLIVPEPMVSRDGALYVVAETAGVPEPRICTLLGWVDGRFVYKRLTPSHLERVGVFMARLHEHANRWTPDREPSRWLVGSISDDIAASTLATVAEVLPHPAVATVERVLDRARTAQDALGRTQDSYGLIHGDLHSDNYLFYGEDVRTVDFDDCGWGLHLFDMAVALCDIRSFPAYPAMRAALLHGYSTVRPVPPGVDTHLDALIEWRNLQLIVWLIEHRDHPGFAGWEPTVHYLLKPPDVGAGSTATSS